jgi:hypothetical protein
MKIKMSAREAWSGWNNKTIPFAIFSEIEGKVRMKEEERMGESLDGFIAIW